MERWKGEGKEAKATQPTTQQPPRVLYATRQEEEAFEFRTGRKLTWTGPWDPRVHVDVASRGTRPARVNANDDLP